MDFKNWLNLRYEIDAQSRNKDIETSFLRKLGKDHNIIVDLGAGTGSNFRYYHDKIPSENQHWFLVDQGHELLEETLVNLSKAGMSCERNKNQVFLSKGAYQYTLELVIADIFSDQVDPFLNKADIIVSNAFFDLASEVQLQDFLGKIRRTPNFLATINYEGMHFDDNSREDKVWIEKYEQHMQRERPSGKSTGPHCVAYMREILNELQVKFQSDSSDWILQPNDPICQGIFDFMDDAFTEMKEDLTAFDAWREKKKSSRMHIIHKDIAF